MEEQSVENMTWWFITAENLSALKFILLNKLSFVKLLYENCVVLCID